MVANAGSQELRFYGPDGHHVRDVGGVGEGPGEFQDMFHAVLCGSASIVAFGSPGVASVRLRQFGAFSQFIQSDVSYRRGVGALVRELPARRQDGRAWKRGVFGSPSC